MESILEWAVPGAGFDICECVENFHQIAEIDFVPFVRWYNDAWKARFREEACIGWEALKVFVDLMKVDVALQHTIEEAREMEGGGRGLSKRKQVVSTP
ncbi:hypothetical protein SUGI_0782900 [Cryptomeria japonica]|nr:hypothetical protein SUGI_0782900 [Cryptomeria japonica]